MEDNRGADGTTASASHDPLSVRSGTVRDLPEGVSGMARRQTATGVPVHPTRCCDYRVIGRFDEDILAIIR